MPSTGPLVSRRAAAATLATGVVGSLAGCTGLSGVATRSHEPLPDATPASTDWPFLRYDARNTGWNDGAEPPTDEPSVRWSRDVGWGFTPLVRDGRVVVGTYDGIGVYRTDDGGRVWLAGPDPNYREPSLGARRVYAPGNEGGVRGFDLATGEATWTQEHPIGANTDAPTVAGGKLVIDAGNVGVYDATGTRTWSTYCANVGPIPAVVDGGRTAFVAPFDAVAALDLTAPAREWPWEDPDGEEPPRASRERAYRWSAGAPEAIARIRHSPTVLDGVGDSGGRRGGHRTVYALVERIGRATLRAHAPDTGERRWQFTAGEGENGGFATPTVTNGERVFFGADDGVVYAIPADGGLPDPDGSSVAPRDEPVPEWSRAFDALPNRLAGAGRTLLVGTYRDGGPTSLYALDAGSGRARWRVRYDDELRGLSAAGGTVYATVVTERDADGDIVGTTLYAYE